jgi:hypothetical protein
MAPTARYSSVGLDPSGFEIVRRLLAHLGKTLVQNGLSLHKDTPISRAVETAGRILCRAILGGLHHQYARI